MKICSHYSLSDIYRWGPLSVGSTVKICSHYSLSDIYRWGPLSVGSTVKICSHYSLSDIQVGSSVCRQHCEDL